jgi:hypothetical protein
MPQSKQASWERRISRRRGNKLVLFGGGKAKKLQEFHDTAKCLPATPTALAPAAIEMKSTLSMCGMQPEGRRYLHRLQQAAHGQSYPWTLEFDCDARSEVGGSRSNHI